MSIFKRVHIFSPITPDSDNQYSNIYSFEYHQIIADKGIDRIVRREYQHISKSSRSRLETVLNGPYTDENKLGKDQNMRWPMVYIQPDSIAVSYIFYIHKD